MSSTEINALKRKLRFSYFAIAILVIVSIGFFFYGLINNIQAMKDKEQALIFKIKSKECESESIKMMQHVRLAQQEALKQHALALDALDKAKGNTRK